MPGTLSIIATPIGNLGDITLRAIETLRAVDVLFCEDTRTTRKLLDRHGITATMDSYREEAHERKTRRVIELLEEGKHVGLVSDAGTPGIADPGSRLVRDVIDALPDTKVVPIPGPSAIAAAISIAGFPADGFVFLGWPPHKKGRNAFFDKAMAQDLPVVLYESPHRVTKAFAELAKRDSMRSIASCRELTKLHEEVERGTAAELAAQYETKEPRGEYVIVIDRA
jgi:16S rRNA (cytidine1402-2'-O)-methyltransferase